MENVYRIGVSTPWSLSMFISLFTAVKILKRENTAEITMFKGFRHKVAV